MPSKGSSILHSARRGTTKASVEVSCRWIFVSQVGDSKLGNIRGWQSLNIWSIRNSEVQQKRIIFHICSLYKIWTWPASGLVFKRRSGEFNRAYLGCWNEYCYCPCMMIGLRGRRDRCVAVVSVVRLKYMQYAHCLPMAKMIGLEEYDEERSLYPRLDGGMRRRRRNRWNWFTCIMRWKWHDGRDDETGMVNCALPILKWTSSSSSSTTDWLATFPTTAVAAAASPINNKWFHHVHGQPRK